MPRTARASAAEDDEDLRRFRLHGRTGRPLGDAAFTARLEARLHRLLRRNRPGPKPKTLER